MPDSINFQVRDEQGDQTNSESNGRTRSVGEKPSGLQFEDNRPQTIARKKQQEKIEKSPIVRDKRRLLDLISDSAVRQPIQRQKQQARTDNDTLRTGIESTSDMSLDEVKSYYAQDHGVLNQLRDQRGTIQRIIGNHGAKVIGRKVKHDASVAPVKKGEEHLYQNLVVERVIGFEKGQFIYSVSNEHVGHRVEASDLAWDLTDELDEKTVRKQLPPSLWDGILAGYSAILTINLAGFLVNCFQPRGRTPTDLVQDLEVKMASQIVNQFLNRIGVSGRVDEKNTQVKFYSGDEWAREYKNSQRKGSDSDSADVEGFELHNNISINQDSHTVGTLVHEMLHRVSDCAYGRSFWEEAMTEYFTQLAMSVDARFSIDNNHSPYIGNVKLLKMLIAAKKLTHEEIVAIYFKGDRKAAQKMRKLINDKS